MKEDICEVMDEDYAMRCFERAEQVWGDRKKEVEWHNKQGGIFLGVDPALGYLEFKNKEEWMKYLDKIFEANLKRDLKQRGIEFLMNWKKEEI